MTRYEPREHVIDAELANGNLDAWRQVLGFPNPRRNEMALYRRKPGNPIEARQWSLNDGDVFMMADWPGVQFDHGAGRAYIETMHAGQRVFLENGDWILPEPDGIHFYPCKPDIFASTYEPV